jgi:non-homologous end joining protein Ku
MTEYTSTKYAKSTKIGLSKLVLVHHMRMVQIHVQSKGYKHLFRTVNFG